MRRGEGAVGFIEERRLRRGSTQCEYRIGGVLPVGTWVPRGNTSSKSGTGGEWRMIE